MTQSTAQAVSAEFVTALKPDDVRRQPRKKWLKSLRIPGTI